MLSLPVQERFRRFIRPHIKQLLKELNYHIDFDMDRITVWADTDAFKWKEDVSVWSQKRGRTDNIYSVFVDNIHICYIGERRSKPDTLKDFWHGFLKAYSLKDNDPGKLWLDHETYEEKRKERQERDKKHKESIIKAIQDKKVTSAVQAEAKEIALDVVKES